MQLRANFNWKLSIFVVIFFPLTVALGFWQLDRAEEKRGLMLEHESLKTQTPIHIVNRGIAQRDYNSHEFNALQHRREDVLDKIEPWRNYQPALTAGVFDRRIFLLDNQVYKGRVGYEVIQPLKLREGQWLLVSRGFVPGDLDRRILPDVPSPSERVVLSGYLYKPVGNFELADNPLSHSWPQVIQSPEPEKLYEVLDNNGKIGNRFILRLNRDSPHVFSAHWQIINVKPEKHVAYAVQWFAMALLLVLLFLYASINIEKTRK